MQKLQHHTLQYVLDRKGAHFVLSINFKSFRAFGIPARSIFDTSHPTQESLQ